MSKPDIDAVRATISEFDQIGRSAFMDRYGFADRNITYQVEIDGKLYPSKAIFGAAFARVPGETARNSETCDGRDAHIHLAKLGLKVIADGVASSETAEADPKQADKIRSFVRETYIEPARKEGRETIEIVSGDVHSAMGLKNAVPAVCSVLEGKALAEVAGVELIDRRSPIGSDKPSTTIRYQFRLSNVGRLTLDQQALSRLRERFLEKHSDFVTFAECPSFEAGEGKYKQVLLTRAAELMSQGGLDDKEIGTAMLNLASGKGGVFSNLIDWRASGLVDEVRAAHPGAVETAIGRMVRADHGVESVDACVAEFWPLFIEGRSSKPYAESRMVPTMVRALVEPDAMLGIRSTPTNNAHKMLLGKPAFAWQALSRPELESVLGMANELFRVMQDVWGWKPRSLWDVQGFIWETCQALLDEMPKPNTPSVSNDNQGEAKMQRPTNLILYGPPGTGKTYTTAREAVALCGEDVPNDREALMAVYRSLQQKGRIGFVTFHQNFSYEDFVEGLRPVTSDGEGEAGSAGFALEAQDGIFKQMAELASSNRGKAVDAQPAAIDRSRKIFKMSLGRSWASEDDAIFEDAIRDGYVVLGWGGDVDWSDPSFDQWEALKARWRQDHPTATSNDPNVSQMYAFRINMQVGSLVVISDGNRKFRAVGEITGPYRFVPGPNGEYNHRRSVRWLWHGESLPREQIYNKVFSQVSAYQLNSQFVNWEGLEQIVSSGGGVVATSGAPESYVLIIDEINRANISKVFGELITLLEADKRVGMENALTVRLPYSKTEFGVPANLHVLGTMNTADRSIALLDTALRRRFTFREMPPRPDLLGTRDGVDLFEVLTTINQRIVYLFDREHRIGHAIFMDCETKADVDGVMRDKVIPLLQEYFFEDWGRIRAVLGGGFIKESEIAPPPGFDGLPRKTWSVRPSFSSAAYQQLLSGISAEAEVDEDSEAEGGDA